ncbi:Multiple RNA-binding domain-containing protein 1 [Porphyridium purpureum]|uniref:Multiple RNA-binding domain-containing protein 1 n=1 Tax=Porphyridium purpureum TaxID=35688 RepID=A0A5J4YX06_PORPP|nr:Multiple RNA-binding domain-containing protein 1 [Porphyridium purpureum]|eukprot:POR1813..scf209_3
MKALTSRQGDWRGCRALGSMATSRIVVKGLPKHADEKRLREVFGQVGPVTDAKVIHNKEGRSRQFGFVGFKNEHDALKALKRFHNTFLDTSRIVVEPAFGVASDDRARLAEREKNDGSARRRAHQNASAAQRAPASKVDKRKSAAAEQPDSPLSAPEHANSTARLGEFMDVMRTARKRAVWEDDALPVAEAVDAAARSKPEKRTKVDVSDPELYDGGNRKTGVPSGGSDSDSHPEDKHHARFTSDLEFLQSKKIEGDLLSDEDGDEKEAEAQILEKHHSQNGEEEEEEEEEQEDAQEEDFEDGRLFVRNLPFGSTEEEVAEWFRGHGPVVNVHMVVDRATKAPRGYAYVTFALPDHARKACLDLDGRIFQGRLLQVLPAKTNHANGGTWNPEGVSKTFKEGRLQEKKESAGKGTDSVSWGSLFMNADAVAEVISSRLGVSKGELLGVETGESGSAAVRLAAAEAQLQNEAKRSLHSLGVDTSAMFSSQRGGGHSFDKKCMLVKNLPADTSEQELRTLFEKYGTISLWQLLASGLIGLVRFQHAPDAKNAYRSLAYRRFRKTSILYLEWAPMRAETNEKESESIPVQRAAAVEATSVEKLEKGTDANRRALSDGVQTKAEDSSDGISIFVKNLSFETSEQGVQDMFSEFGALRSVKIAKKKVTHNGTEIMQSMGYGFIEFEIAKDAHAAIQALNGAILDGHALELKVSHRGRETGAGSVGGHASSGKKRTSTGKSSKLVVRNLAFEAKPKDVRALFSAFGPVKGVRMPKKMDGSHRGFAFVEFFTEEEASSAMEALAAAHLFGRHLVMEYAAEQPGISSNS